MLLHGVLGSLSAPSRGFPGLRLQSSLELGSTSLLSCSKQMRKGDKGAHPACHRPKEGTAGWLPTGAQAPRPPAQLHTWGPAELFTQVLKGEPGRVDSPQVWRIGGPLPSPSTPLLIPLSSFKKTNSSGFSGKEPKLKSPETGPF